jgi:hypothetical protein
MNEALSQEVEVLAGLMFLIAGGSAVKWFGLSPLPTDQQLVLLFLIGTCLGLLLVLAGVWLLFGAVGRMVYPVGRQ